MKILSNILVKAGVIVDNYVAIGTNSPYAGYNIDSRGSHNFGTTSTEVYHYFQSSNVSGGSALTVSANNTSANSGRSQIMVSDTNSSVLSRFGIGVYTGTGMYAYLDSASLLVMNANSGANVSIGGIVDTGYKLNIEGSVRIKAPSDGQILFGSQGNSYPGISLNGTLDSSNYNFTSNNVDKTLYINSPSGYGIKFRQNNSDRMVLADNGVLSVVSLAGTGSRMVVADSSGVLSTQALPSLSGYVPYSGATTSVDLGEYALYSKNIVNKANVNLVGTVSGSDTIAGSLAIKTSTFGYTWGGVGYVSLSSFVDKALSIIIPNGSGGSILGNLSLSSLTASRTYTLPDASGTLALTSDIPSLTNYVTTNTSQTISGAKTFSNNIRIDNGSASAFLGFKQYASGSTGTAGFTSIYAISTDTFGISFGGANDILFKTASPTFPRTYTFPNANGTVALTSDIPSLSGYLPYTGATTTLQMGNNNISVGDGSASTSQFVTIVGNGFGGFVYENAGSRIRMNQDSLIVTDKQSSPTYTKTLQFRGSIYTANYSIFLPDASGTVALTSDLSAYVPTSRTLTINGTTFDLSANRSWTVEGGSSASTRVIQKFTSTANQTTFTITGGYTVGMVDVFLNGVKIDNATDFTATNGTTVVLTEALAAGQTVEVYKYGSQFIVNNGLRQTTLFSATAGQTTFTVNYSVGLVDVFYNGSKLDSSEYTATNGTSIVLGTACAVNDKVEVIAYSYNVGAFTGIGGSGTINYIPKFTASGTIGNSLLFDTGTAIVIGNGQSSATPQLGLLEATDGSGTNIAGAEFRLQGGQGTGTGAGGAITFYTAPAGSTGSATNAAIERMRITPTGSVGISTSTPWGKFNVVDGTNKSFVVQDSGTADTIELTNYSSGGGLRAIQLNGSVVTFGTGTAGGGSSPERMRINSTGNIGIGTSTIDQRLVLQNSTSEVGIKLTDGTNNTFFAHAAANNNYGNGVLAGDAVVRGSNGISLAPNNGSAVAMRITSGNNVEIANGTFIVSAGSGTGYSSRLQTVYSFPYVDTYLDSVAGTSYEGRLRFRTNANNGGFADRMIIQNDGRVLVNTTSTFSSGLLCLSGDSGTYNMLAIRDTGSAYTDNWYAYFVNASNTRAGGVQHTGSTSVAFITTSDYRLKENPKPIQDGLNKVLALKPITYNWKEDGSEGEGFYAHELQEQIPFAVYGEKDAVDKDGKINPQGVDYSKVVPTLVKAIQELKSERDADKKEIELLKAQLGSN